MNLLELKPNISTIEVAGGTVHVRELTGADRAALQRLAGDYEKAGKPDSELVTHLVILSVCDSDGTRLYTAKDFDRLNALPASVLDQLAKHARTINGLDEAAVEDAKKN